MSYWLASISLPIVANESEGILKPFFMELPFDGRPWSVVERETVFAKL